MDVAKKAEDGNPRTKTRNLLSDVMFEILTRVPFQYIDACRAVCKTWNSITCEPTFKPMHSKRTQTISGFFVQSIFRNQYKSFFLSLHQSPDIPPPSLNFLPEDVKIVASSRRGLLCCISQQIQERRTSNSWRIPRYYVCKPATKEWRQIPNPKTRYFTVRVEMAVQSMKPLHYKLVRFSWPLHTRRYLRCEIFDSASSWAWRQSENVCLPESTLLLPDPGVLNHGAMHWLTTTHEIYAFDMNNETWNVISLPQDGPELDGLNWVRAKIVECGGKLSLIYHNNVWMELWVMEDYIKQTWERKRTVGLLEALKKTCPYYSLLSLYSTEILLLRWASKFIWYNYQKDKQYSTATKVVEAISLQDAHTFESDLVPCNI